MKGIYRHQKKKDVISIQLGVTWKDGAAGKRKKSYSMKRKVRKISLPYSEVGRP
jgi:hypothetical protein